MCLISGFEAYLARNSAQKESEETFRALTRGEGSPLERPKSCRRGQGGRRRCSGGSEVYYKGGTSFSWFSQVPGRTLLCTCPGQTPRGTPDARPLQRREDSLPLVPRRRLPDLKLSRLITTACALAVYASQRGVTPTPRKTRFRWVANPCRVGFGPTGSTTKGFRFCLLQLSSSLPRLGLAQGTSFRGAFYRNRSIEGVGQST